MKYYFEYGIGIAGAATFIESCNHNGCSKGYNQSANDFVCPCHGEVIDINGKVTSVLPSVPLKKHTVTRADNILTISGLELLLNPIVHLSLRKF